MQTFLPYPDFEESAASLDAPRLGKQRVETLQILRALELPEYGWANHPAVVMWRHHVPALVLYGLICARAWTRLGHADTTYDQMAEFAPDVAGLDQDDLAARGQLPSWLGDPQLHLSHRSKLLAKDPAFYGARFRGTPTDLDYHWPGPDPAPPPAPVRTGDTLWVVPAESSARLGTCLEQGMIALGTESGMTGDATGHEIEDLQAALGLTRRRTKPLVALARFVNEIRTGDRVAVFVEHRARLLVGTVTGDYRWARTAEHGLHHQRPVAFDGVLVRSDVDPPASLQDVRPLFRVRLRTPTG
ncbi:MSMEG_6728 family protein [Nakamurella deserti]|uniref:MSMEG_6728 family protein n=1 Tax=Nakamurella deserti TaxID=2164074 RepID=UPI000DBEA76C|nr:MSMEG_6728 family protein [Nakamurella deserti]